MRQLRNGARIRHAFAASDHGFHLALPAALRARPVSELIALQAGSCATISASPSGIRLGDYLIEGTADALGLEQKY